MSNCSDSLVHQFEPRYDLVVPSAMDTFFHSVTGSADELKNKIYVCDICVKCGKKEKRP
jgi:hypothetical protein